MLLAPVLTGGLLAGFKWQNALLMAAWVTAYLGFTAVRGAITGRQRKLHAIAAAVYCVCAAVAIAALLWWRIALLWWGIPLAVSLGASLCLIVKGRERSAVNDACLIGASALMTAVSGTCLRLAPSPAWQSFVTAISTPVVWIATAVMSGYFLGTIPYVKTMIRERGNKAWYIGSVAYHCILVVLAILTLNAWLVAFAVLITLRAALVPKLWPRAKPKNIGIGEMTGTALIILIVCLTVA